MSKKVKLIEVSEFIKNGLPVKQSKDIKGCPITRIETISHGLVDFDSVGYADISANDNANWLLKNGDILISHINSEKHLGKCAIFEDTRELIHGMNLLNFRCTNNILPKYLFFYFKTNIFRKEISKFMKKSVNQASFSIGDFKNIEINLPTIDKQKLIAKTLDKANELIELRKESITKLDALAKSIFIDMFGDPVSNPKKWEIKKLKQLTDVKTGKTPSRAEPLYWEGGTELWATTTEVNKRFIFDTQEKVTKYAVEKCNLTVYPENTILIAMYGQGKTRGNVVLLKTKSTINQAFGAILSSENINQEFLLSLLKNSYSHIRSLGRGGNQENLNLDIVKNLDIINPSIALQNKFAKIIEKIEEQKSLYTQELEKLQINFDALLQKSFQ